MYINLPQWSTCKIPMVRDMDLHAFWGASPLRITAYSLPQGADTEKHLQSKVNYLVCVEIAHGAHAALEAEGSCDEAGSEGDEYPCAEGSWGYESVGVYMLLR